MHDQHPTMSYVDLNRSGVALMEIVSKPDMRSADEAKAYVTKLRTIVRYLGTCDGNMDEGSMRADVNVSVRKPGGEFGTRCEIKNVNSIRFIGQAIEYEARRQIAILEDGGKIDQETRLFDADKGETRSMRSKEEAHDYRYFPDPDLLPLEFDQAYVDALAKDLPELPDDKKARLIAIARPVRPTTPRSWCRKRRSPTISRRWPPAATASSPPTGSSTICSAQLNKAGKDIENAPVSPDQLGAVIDLIKEGTISGKIAKDLFEIVWNEGGDPRAAGREPRHEAGHRHRRHREGGRRGDRRQPRQGRAGARQADHGRLVRRPGDEGDRRQGQSAGGQRPGQGQARHRVRRCSSAPPANATLPPSATLLVETWHATYDAIYGAERVTEITDDWHSIASLQGAADAAELGIPGCR